MRPLRGAPTIGIIPRLAMKTDTAIRARRLALRLPQRVVAHRAQVSETQLRKWERGLELPDRDSVNRIAHVLDLDPHFLIGAQLEYATKATPGEGYTTATAGNGAIVRRRLEPPARMRSVLDLFCGSGGLSYGFEQSGGFLTTCGIDLLPDRIQTFVANHKHANAIAGDIRRYSFRQLHDFSGDVAVVVGGPPCQGFSSIRPFRTLTEGDPRNSLGEHYVLAIRHLKPEWFVFENVVGLLTHERGARLHSLLDGLHRAGYTVDWRVINVASYGIPQYRERVVIVGNRLRIKFLWPNPTHRALYRSMAGTRGRLVQSTPLFDAPVPDAVTTMEAIGDLPAVAAGEEATSYVAGPRTRYQALMRAGAPQLSLHKATYHSPRMLQIIRHAGSNISALPRGMVTSGFTSCYSRLDPDRPSTTLTVNFVHPASNRCIHPYQHRALTPREGARIQGFPDRFQFRGTRSQIVKQIGNAVPPLLGQRIAEAIVRSEEVRELIG